MKLEQSFTVTAPVDQVWAMLIDVERVAPCLPGAEITGQAPDGAYQGTFSVKLGPATAAYNGSLRMESVDEGTHTATMSAKGTDKRGQGGANATIVSTMREEGGETTVDVATDFTITGRLARFGRGGMIEDISKRLMRDFAQCLQATLAAEQDAGLAPMAAPDAATVLEEQVAAEAAAASPLPGQEAADEPLQPAQAPWPPRAPEPEPPSGEPAASEPAGEPAASEAAGEPAASEAAPLAGEPAPPADAPLAGEPAPPVDAPLPEAAAADVAPAEAEPEAPAAAEPPPPAAAEPHAAAEPPAAAEPAAPAEPTAPRSSSIPPPTAAPRPAAQPAKPISGFSLFFGVLWDRVKRFFGRLFGRKRES
jgi:carbon monoxide dehydrogenase subunit G